MQHLKKKIKHIGITYILPVGSSNHPLFNQGMNKLKDVIYYPNYIDITDFHTENLLVHFMDAIKFIDESISKGKILVHCAAGVSRSAAIVIAYLMWKKNGILLKQRNLLVHVGQLYVLIVDLKSN